MRLGKLLVGIVVAVMILGPYRITADEKKVDLAPSVKKVKQLLQLHYQCCYTIGDCATNRKGKNPRRNNLPC
jgi:hypothetical protein